MSCEIFLSSMDAAELTADGLAHIRTCASCLSASVSANPDNLFRSLGGEELSPDGGIDAFVADVVQQVHIRRTEVSMEPSRRHVPLVYRWSLAAAVSAAVLTGFLQFGVAPVEPTGARSSTPIASHSPLATRPVIESYQSEEATIVELPSDPSSNIQVVMVFDETLPVDL